MDKAEEFMRHYEKMQSDFMKTYLSDPKISPYNKDHPDQEAEYEYISGNEEDDHSVDSIPIEYLFQKDSSDSSSSSDSESDKESDKELFHIKMMPSLSKSLFSSRCDGTGKAINLSTKEIKEHEKKIRMEEANWQQEEEEKSRPIQSFKYWRSFQDIAIQQTGNEFNISQFYRDLRAKWLPNLHLTKTKCIYHYLEKAGSKTSCHLIPSELMSMLLIQHQFPYEWQLLLREMFPKTYNPHTHKINSELYYRYVDKMIEEYEKDDVDEEFMKKYVLLNVLLTIFMFRREILHIVYLNRYQSIQIDITKPIHTEESNETISQYGMDYSILFQLALWLSQSYENEIYPHIFDIYAMAIIMSS